MRRIFVGDIQGCLAQLRALLEAADFARGRDVLVPVGDMVNKGPDSEGVLDLLIDVEAQPVLGNHDLHWLDQGKGSVAHREWLRAQPLVRVDEDVIAVHAGLHPEWEEAHLETLGGGDVDYAVNVRYCDARGARPPRDWPPPGPPYRPWDDFYRGRKRVVFGHWARRGLVVRPRCVGLDTGCVYSGKLSAWIAEEDRVVQVDGWRR
ncbi:MAG: metallophosphoesterase [Planctomycetota bacterium]|nr:metallophosphoesterase [Planctomycetota bacterium]